MCPVAGYPGRNPFVNQVFVVRDFYIQRSRARHRRNPFVNQVFVVCSGKRLPERSRPASQSLRKSGLCRHGAGPGNRRRCGRRNPFVNQVFVVTEQTGKLSRHNDGRNPFVNQVFVVCSQQKIIPPNGRSQSLRKSGLCRRVSRQLDRARCLEVAIPS